MSLIHLQLKNPKDDETPIEAATQIFSSLLSSGHVPFWKHIFSKTKPISFELYLLGQTIYFYISAPAESETLIASLLTSSFPKLNLTKTQDPMDLILKNAYVEAGEMVLRQPFYLPTKTYADFKDIDPLSSLLGFLAKQPPNINMAIQILVAPASFNWQNKAVGLANKEVYDAASERYSSHPQKLIILRKTAFPGGKVAVRLAVGTESKHTAILGELAGTFGSFSLGEGNQFALRKPLFFKKKLINKLKSRSLAYFEAGNQILNAQELATIWHPPGILLGGIKNIAWGKALLGEPPENLPTAPNTTEEEKQDTNFFAKTEFKNQEVIFGIKTPDRRKHVYIIGKTGTGKSTLIANMAIDDIRKGRGVGIIDPHGDLSETILNYIPKRRLADVVYLEPFDPERVFALNVLEVKNKQQKELVASGIVSIFYKLYRESWGPRLEYILRNVILTLLEVEGSTLVDVLRILSDNDYRRRVVDQLQDRVLKSFWENEFARMSDNFRSEAVSPIQNKVGQFISSKLIRNIVGSPRSTLDLEAIMNEGKILILNLSQGKLGEDNAALLGAMVITQLQLAAMNRSYQAEEERRDFFLYVDEFQNFATNSFVKILSEARKYRLCLTLANQYIEQLDLPVQKAVFGNVGTLMSFVVGASDAKVLSYEFGELYSENELVSLGQYEIISKLSVGGQTSLPFPAKTLPLPSVKNENKEKIVRLSKEKYARNVTP